VHSEQSRLGRDISISTAGAFGLRLSGAVGGVLVARLLGATGRGTLAICVVIASIVGTAMTAGLPFWIIRVTAQVGVVHQVVRIIQRHLSIVALLCGAGLLGMWPMDTNDAGFAALTIGLAFAWVFGALWIAIPNGLRHMGTVLTGTAGGGLVYFAGITVLLAADQRSVELALVVTLASQLWVGLIGWRDMRLSGIQDDAQSKGASRYSNVLRQSLPAGLGELLALATLRVDVLIVGALLDPQSVGIYAVALAVADLPLMLADPIAQVALPFVAEDERGRAVDRLTRILIVTMLLASAALAVTTPLLLPLVFGRQFEEAVTVVPFLLVGTTCLGVWKVVAADLSARGHHSPRLLAAGVALAIMVPADLVLVPRCGLIGAGIASSLSYGGAVLVVASRWSKLTHRPARSLVRIRSHDLSIAGRTLLNQVRGAK
jgi:O-antigen/teichoic acid export membrane protein